MIGVIFRVALRVRDTEAEGPGRRYALWVQGCPLRCAGCCNPEMFSAVGGELCDPLALAREAIATAGIEGVTLLGGEPFEQAEACASFAAAVRGAGLSVMVFSGFTLAELEQKQEPGVRRLLDACDLLVDGRYDRTQPERRRRWIGSQNQVMHFLSNRYRQDDPRLFERNTIELRLVGGTLTVNGWPA